MAVSVSYREATTGDVARIREIARVCWDRDYPDIVSRESLRAGFEEWYDSDRLRREISTGDAFVLIAETDAGEVVGFAHALREGEASDLLRMYVDPGHRGEGIGNGLLDQTAVELAGRGAEVLRAMVLSENDLGNEFYRAAGFMEVDEGETVIGEESYAETVYERPIDRE